jgi:DNA-binding YbaB/EbfC family protein
MAPDFSEMMKNLPNLMGQVKEMQGRLQKLRIEGSAGGGMVTVTMNGAGEVVDVQIEPDVIDPEDPEMLSDLVVAACADAKKNVAAKAREEMSGLTGGLDLSSLGINLPGLGS